MHRRLFVLVLMGSALLRGEGLWKWSLAAVAAANVADGVTSAGRHELNPVLGGGRFGARAVGVKVGISAAVVGVQWLVVRRNPAAARKAAWINFAMAGATGAVAASNKRR